MQSCGKKATSLWIFWHKRMPISASFIAKTPNSQIVYTIATECVDPRNMLCCMDARRFNALCKSGCANYGKKWSCPPFAPGFDEFSAQWERLFILYASIDLSQFFYIKNDYLKVKAANSILKSRTDKFLRKMAMQYGRNISTGSCRLCKPCKRTKELPCANPTRMAYSFEAMGVNVEQLINKCFDKPLQWYKPKELPEYTSVVCGLLTNEHFTQDFLLKEYRAFAVTI